jgi:tRNA(fMet)-specific endonuclease VapC
MIVLDTNHMSHLERAGSPEALRLRARLEAVPDEEVVTTIISYEEQTRGWLSFVARARTLAQQIDAYDRLNRQRENYGRFRVLDFDDRAAAEFQRLTSAKIRIGTMDLKLAHDAMLVSRNLTDFRKVPGLRVEDWTVDPSPPSDHPP